MKRLTIFLLLLATTALGQKPDQHAVIAEFVDLLAIPNLASDAPNIARNAAAVQAMFEKRGVPTRLLTLEGAPPIVIGDIHVTGATRTIAFYAHYDGQPVDATQWKSAPWTPVMRDAAGNDIDWRNARELNPEWRIYARSAGDDKTPIIGMASALDALRAAGHKPAVNLRFVFEGEEEAGSPHLAGIWPGIPRCFVRTRGFSATGRYTRAGACNSSSGHAAWSISS